MRSTLKFLAGLTLAIFLSAAAQAQSYIAGTGTYSSVTVGTSSAQALAAGSASKFLDIMNESASATIACAFGATAVINGGGSITFPPGWHRSWEGSFVPTDAVNCIASGASTPATIGVK
jgi:hypothetical protein